MSLPFQFIKFGFSILFIAISAQLSIDLPIGQTMIPISTGLNWTTNLCRW